MKADIVTRDKSLIGAAGVHFVVSELSLNGLIALPTVRNTAGIDVLVSNADGSWNANLQVKTSRSRVNFWPIGTKYRDWLGEHCYYVFLRWDSNEARFEGFLESAARVARDAEKAFQSGRDRGIKDWAPWWPLPNDEGERERVKTAMVELRANDRPD
jgi:hypothetical protein